MQITKIIFESEITCPHCKNANKIEVSQDDVIQVYDENYYVLDPDNTSGDYKEYNAGGNYPEVGEGQKKKLNTQYIVNKRDNKILITIGENSSIILDIE